MNIRYFKTWFKTSEEFLKSGFIIDVCLLAVEIINKESSPAVLKLATEKDFGD